MIHRTWKTAVVTGASSGIGDAFCRRLAVEGTDLVVTARDEGRLTRLAEQLRATRGIDVEVLVADLADQDGRHLVEARLADRDRPIDLLVNNAGFGDSGPFHECDVDRQQAQVEVNITAVVRLTHAALGPMLDRGRGTILNVSSVVSRTPSPTHAVYAASKAFVTSFSEGLHEDLRERPVTITALEPGFTETEFQERAGVTHLETVPDFVWMTPDKVAAAGLRGARAGRAVVLPAVGYKAVMGAVDILPKAAVRNLIGIAARRL